MPTYSQAGRFGPAVISGAPVGVPLRVLDATGSDALLFRDASKNKTMSPFVRSDDAGLVTFHADPGTYSVRWTGGSATVTVAGVAARASTAPPAVGQVFTPAEGVLAALRRGQSACMGLVSDSTGDEGIAEWFGILGQRIATRYGANLVYQTWSDTNQNYNMPTTLQSGPAGERYASFAAGSLSYTGPASITGDVEIVMRIRMPVWASGSTQTIASKYDTASGNNRGWFLQISPSGRLGFQWSADGITGNLSSHGSVLPFANGEWGLVKVLFDVDNGATGNALTVSTSTDNGATWVPLGTANTVAGVASIFNNSTIPYMIGGWGLPTPVNPFTGDIAWIEIRNGISGPTMAPPMPDDWDQETGAASNTLTFVGSPTLWMVAGAQSGQNFAYFDNVTRRPKLLAQKGQRLLFISNGHNEANQTSSKWLNLYSAFVTNAKTLLPGIPLVGITQNPTSSPLTANTQAVRAKRGSWLATWGASQAGVYVVDTYAAFSNAAVENKADGLHPSIVGGAPAGTSGSEVWADHVDRVLFGATSGL